MDGVGNPGVSGGNWELGWREPGVGEAGTENESGVRGGGKREYKNVRGGKRKSESRAAGVKGEGSGNWRPPVHPSNLLALNFILFHYYTIIIRPFKGIFASQLHPWHR